MVDNLIEMASTYIHSRLKLFRKIVWPRLYPYVFAATRSSFMTAWKIVVPAEIFGANSGMGYMLSLAFDMYRIEGVFGWSWYSPSSSLCSITDFSLSRQEYMRKWKPQELKPCSKDLRKNFGKLDVLGGISFSIQRGDWCASWGRRAVADYGVAHRGGRYLLRRHGSGGRAGYTQKPRTLSTRVRCFSGAPPAALARARQMCTCRLNCSVTQKRG